MPDGLRPIPPIAGRAVMVYRYACHHRRLLPSRGATDSVSGLASMAGPPRYHSPHDLETTALFRGGHCRLDEPAAAGSDSISQGREPDSPGEAWPETHPPQRRAEATVGGGSRSPTYCRLRGMSVGNSSAVKLLVSRALAELGLSVLTFIYEPCRPYYVNADVDRHEPEKTAEALKSHMAPTVASRMRLEMAMGTL